MRPDSPGATVVRNSGRRLPQGCQDFYRQTLLLSVEAEDEFARTTLADQIAEQGVLSTQDLFTLIVRFGVPL